MEPEITSLIQPSHLQELARLWQGVPPQAPLDDVENLVYPFFCQGRPRILRLAHESRRTLQQVCAELDWIRYLTSGGVPAAAPVPSCNGRLAEVIEVPGSTFVACVFERAPGGPPHLDDPNLDQEAFYREWGRIVGRMHALTKSYDPGPYRGHRSSWREQASGLDLHRAGEIIPPEEKAAVARAEELSAFLDSLPTDLDSYGLVHDDLNSTNFFLDGQRITLFDFDDCCYDWFVSDLAATVPYFSPRFSGKRGEEEARRYFHHFFSGYRRENELAAVWLERLPTFLRLHNLSGVLFSYTIDRDNREEYKDYFDLLWRVYREDCTLFHFDFLQSYRDARPA
ncbi:MAG: phosphotransferase [bacterium]